MMIEPTVYNYFLIGALIVAILVSIPVIWRMLIGPDIADRVTSFDVLTCIVIGFLGIFSILTNNKAYIDVILILSLVVFIGAIAFSYYINKKSENDR